MIRSKETMSSGGGQNTLLRYCPPRCLASIATSGRGLFEINVEPTNQYVVDYGTDGTGKFWRNQESERQQAVLKMITLR